MFKIIKRHDESANPPGLKSMGDISPEEVCIILSGRWVGYYCRKLGAPLEFAVEILGSGLVVVFEDIKWPAVRPLGPGESVQIELSND